MLWKRLESKSALLPFLAHRMTMDKNKTQFLQETTVQHVVDMDIGED